MDKYEYKIRSQEIKTLIERGEYAEAAAIADTVDWRRVKSVMMLCTISDLYKANRRLEDSMDMLLLAYERHPGGRAIVYSLCELCIRTGDIVQAVEYYKEFVQNAPSDNSRYILQYKLYEAQEVGLEERIAVLESLKETEDFTEKWAYELAYLYHRVGLATQCVEECDHLILWFGSGKYVMKAMELKMLHEPLTRNQQEKYNREKSGARTDVYEESYDYAEPVYEEPAYEENIADAPTVEIPSQEMDIQVKVMGVGEYDTINMQKELAENMKELWEGPLPEETAGNSFAWEKVDAQQSDEAQTDEMDAVTQSIVAPMMETQGWEPVEVPEEAPIQPDFQEIKTEEVFFETGEMDLTASQVMQQMKAENGGSGLQGESLLEDAARGQEKTEQNGGVPPVKTYEKILGMEYDGQISLLLPESEQIEKQITGQIKLDDILLEWEKMKKDSEQKRMDAVRQRVMQQTGAMFTEFEAAMRDGLLEKLEGKKKQEETASRVSAKEDAPGGKRQAEELLAEDIPEVEDILEVEEELTGGETLEEQKEGAAAEAEPTEEPAGEPIPEEASGGEELTEDGASDDEFIEDEIIEDEIIEDEPMEEAVHEEYQEEPMEEAAVEEQADNDYMEENYEELPEEEAYEQNYAEEAEAEAWSGAEETDSTQVKGRPANGGRTMLPEERELFGAYIQTKAASEQILHAIDSISLAAYTGNVILTGDEGMDTLNLAKNLIKQVQASDSNFSGKIAKISGESLNKKDMAATLAKLANGALIIQKASAMKKDSAEKLYRALEQEAHGIVIILVDTKKAMNRMLNDNPQLTESFNIRVDMEALDNDTLVKFGRKYARDLEYSIDELGVLALHTRIADRQTSDHAVTVAEVRVIMNEAIHHANRKTPAHFFDILFAKRYDKEDMIILREKDFV